MWTSQGGTSVVLMIGGALDDRGRTGLKCTQGSPQSLSAAKPGRLSLVSLPPVRQPSGRPEETAGGNSSERHASWR